MKSNKLRDWWVFVDPDGKFFAIEDLECKRPVIKGVICVGIGAFKDPVDAIEYFKYVEANKPMQRRKKK